MARRTMAARRTQLKEGSPSCLEDIQNSSSGHCHRRDRDEHNRHHRKKSKNFSIYRTNNVLQGTGKCAYASLSKHNFEGGSKERMWKVDEREVQSEQMVMPPKEKANRKPKGQPYMEKTKAEKERKRKAHNNAMKEESRPHVKKSKMSTNLNAAKWNVLPSASMPDLSLMFELAKFSIKPICNDPLTVEENLTKSKTMKPAAVVQEATEVLLKPLHIKEIRKAVCFNRRIKDGQQAVIVLFKALRFDGKEVLVDNKFMQSNYPHLVSFGTHFL